MEVKLQSSEVRVKLYGETTHVCLLKLIYDQYIT